MRVRRFERNCGWLQKVWNTYDNEGFKSSFRISRETFNFILNRIRNRLTHDTTAGEPISHQERSVIFLYRLSRGDYYHTIAEMTGRGLTTLQCITQEVYKVIFSNLWSQLVNFPETVDQTLTAILQMEDKWQFPSAFGEVDGCHILMKFPSGGNDARKEYYNFKNFCSIVMIGIVGADYKFLWSSVGLPGSSNDACTFLASRLYQNIVGNDFLPEIQKVVKLPNRDELQLPPILLRDSALPHEVWLKKLFGNTALSRK